MPTSVSFSFLLIMILSGNFIKFLAVSFQKFNVALGMYNDQLK